MEKLALKNKLLTESIKRQQSLINDFNTRLADLKVSERIAIEEELDESRSSQKAQVDSEVMLLNSQLQFAKKEMDVLRSLTSTKSSLVDHADLGAVVVTDKGTFFVSSSIEQFKVDGKTYFGLSTQSPLFNVMKGKQKGDRFSLNNITYSIKEIF